MFSKIKKKKSKKKMQLIQPQQNNQSHRTLNVLQCWGGCDYNKVKKKERKYIFFLMEHTASGYEDDAL